VNRKNGARGGVATSQKKPNRINEAAQANGAAPTLTLIRKDSDLPSESSSRVSETPPRGVPPRTGNGKTHYAFEGRIIRLIPTDFQRWRDAYYTLDLRAELTALDDFYAALSKKELGNWFVRCSAALDKKHREQLASRKPPRPRHPTNAELAAL
jgi:hypothetical protein